MAELPARQTERQTEGETRRLEDVAWRHKLRTEDMAWREKLRAEDVIWREKARAEDRAEKGAFHAESLQCLARGLAILAAAQNATMTEELARKAQDFAQWIGDVVGTTHEGT